MGIANISLSRPGVFKQWWDYLLKLKDRWRCLLPQACWNECSTMSFKGVWRRPWRWAQAECRRKRKLTEFIVILVILHSVILMCMLAPTVLDNDVIITEKQQKIGPFIVVFTTTPAVPPSSEYGARDITGKDKQELDKEAVQRLENLRNNVSDFDNYVDSTYPRDISHVDLSSRKDLIPEERYLFEKKRDREDNPVASRNIEDDPVVGRGFEDVYVTYQSDGNGVLLFQENNYSLPDKGVYNNIFSDSNPLNVDGKSTSSNKKEVGENTHDSLSFNGIQHLKVYQNVISNSIDTDFSTPDKILNYKFKNYNDTNPQKYILKDDEQIYFTNVGGRRTCFIKGTNIEKTKQRKGKKCVCLKYYYGRDCGIPEAAWFGSTFSTVDRVDLRLKRRKRPRRVINGLPVNHEFAMFEARMHELSDVVDVFLIIESNYTSHGDQKELYFLKRFQNGYLANFQEKIIYIKLGFFSPEAKEDGWVADSYIRFYMGIKGLPLLNGLRDDDLFLLSDADELPTREIITFLKLYDGYPEPVGFALRWNVFGFYWQMPADSSFMNWLIRAKEKLSVVYSAATIGMLRKVLLKNVFYIRKEMAWEHPTLAENLKRYRKEGHWVDNWVVGTDGHYAGWHCSWCFSPENIVRKMDSAQANDKPRWGDYPEKKNLTYITSRLWQGKWFDDQLKFIPVLNPRARFYAPPYIMKHLEDYRSLLFHPDHHLNRNQTFKPP